MRINFILPGIPMRPSGGFRVIFELANRLAGKKYEVILTFPLNKPSFRPSINWFRKLKKFRQKQEEKQTRSHLRWFKFTNKLRVKYLDKLNAKDLSEADFTIASSWRVAEELMGRGVPKLIHMAQHYEFWNDKIKRINRVCSSDEFIHLCVSKWVKGQLDKLGASRIYHLPIGVNTKLFRLQNEITKRDNNKISFMYHTAQWKGSHLVFNALEILKKRGTKPYSIAFGGYELGDHIVDEYAFNPKQEALAKIYNEVAIFISGSTSEGLGLPPMEAMACGCAVITTDSGGIRDFARNQENCLIVDPNAISISNAIDRLLNDEQLRIKLAKNGHKHITEEFTWDRTVSTFMKILGSR